MVRTRRTNEGNGGSGVLHFTSRVYNVLINADVDHQSYPNSKSYHVSSSVIDLGIKMFWMEVERWNMSTV